MKIRIILGVMMFFAASVAHAAVEADAFVDKTHIRVGDKIRYTLEIKAPEGAEVRFPLTDTSLAGFAVRDTGLANPVKSGKQIQKHSQWRELETFTPGAYIIPPQEIAVTLADGSALDAKTPEVYVEVESLLGSDETQKLQDIKPVLNVKSSHFVWWIAGGVLILLAAAGTAYAVWFRRPKVASPVKAHEAAYVELDIIEGLSRATPGEMKKVTYRITQALRVYIESRFGVKAAEQTTEEFLVEAMQKDYLSPEWRSKLKEFLEHCDLVKYANLRTDEKQIVQLIRTTREFVDVTREREPEPPQKGKGA